MAGDDLADGLSLTAEQVKVLLITTRNDVAEIKQAIAPIKTFQANIQGGIRLLWAVVALSGGVALYSFAQRDADRDRMVKLEDFKESQQSLNATLTNQEAMDRGHADLVPDLLTSVSDLKQRLSAVEAGKIITKTK